MSASRTLEGITWTDTLAWMEPMQGPAWEKVVREEQKRFESLAKKPGTRGLARTIETELEEGFEPFGKRMFRDGTVELAEVGTLSCSWTFAGEEELHTAADVCSNGTDMAWSVEEGGEGDESYSLCLFRKGQKKSVWSHTGVGPFVAVVADRCYGLEVRKRLVCWRLVSWDAMTGRDRKVHYELQDYRYNLELVRCENNLFLKQQAGNKLDVFSLGPHGLRTLDSVSLESRSFVLGSRATDFLVWTAKDGWRASPCLAWTLPPLSEELANPECLDTKRGYLTTKHKGQRTLWKIWQYKPPQKLWEGNGDLRLDPWTGPWIRIVQPGVKARWWNRDGETPCPSPALTVQWDHVKGGCPYMLVKPKGTIRGLFLLGYGAYGLTTMMATHRWEPLRERGFALGILLLRGGGDDSPSWEHSGRVKGRERVLEEAEHTVRVIQTRMGLGPERTCLFGRSAGGLWAGGLTAKYPKGDIAKFVYMEVPYLDVVRTITNRSLPLTEIETDEFGLPAQRLSDLVSAMRWSPMDQEALHTGDGIPGVWQLVRTGMNDSQVYAYESVKWIRRSRGVNASCPAWLAIESGQGHFQHGKKGMSQKALDLAILLQAFPSLQKHSTE